MSVAIVKRTNHDNPVKAAIELCQGFEALKPDHKVFLKPNLVMGTDKKIIPPFGKVTTARVMEQLILALKERGCSNITIGDGAAVMPEIGSDTASALKFSGIERVGKKYGIEMVDFESGTFRKVEMLGHPFRIAASALEADFLINVPVLKTHGQAIVSLGMKNLKGCLKFSSKKRFHKRGQLLALIAHLNMHFKSDLVVIDGTYAMDRGPTMGTAHPMNLIVAGTDILETEMVGTALLGKDPKEIPTIQAYSELTNRPIDLNSVEIRGESIAGLAKDLPWESVNNQSFKNFGVSGMRVAIQSGDTSICSGCLGNMLYANFMFSKDCSGTRADNFEICIGANSKPSANANNVILYGDCAIKNNQDGERALEISGCPPLVGDLYPVLVKKTQPALRATRVLLTRGVKMAATKMGFYHEDVGLWDPYKSSEFDQSLYE
jgi:uncharacterized protein (DUF362 family)